MSSLYEVPNGYKVEFTHRQWSKLICFEWNGHEITPRGYTHCILKSPAGIILSESIAWCRNIDQFNKSIGREISTGRAVKAYLKGDGLKLDQKLMTRLQIASENN